MTSLLSFVVLRPRVSSGLVGLVRPYSMWPSEFEDPVRHKKEFRPMRESGEFERKRFVPIKAASNDANCSIFGDDLVVRFRNTFMQGGQKELADRILRQTFDLVKAAQLKKFRAAPEERKELIVTDPVQLLHMAVENARPMLSIEQVRVGSVHYQVPSPITDHRSYFEGIRWIIHEARERDRAAQFFHERLAEVIVDTAMYTGRVIEKKHEHHRICEQNRAYAHYRKSK